MAEIMQARRQVVNRVKVFLDRQAEAHNQIFAQSRPYAYPHGYWTHEVFHNGYTLIPQAVVTCIAEPRLDQPTQTLSLLGTEQTYQIGGRSHWSPVSITYLPSDVSEMLIKDSGELMMAHNCTSELTYWLGVDKPERTWTLNRWTVQSFSAAAPKDSSAWAVDMTFLYSEAILTRH